MNEQEKREKVIKGLTCHVHGHPHTRCHKCPYWGTGPHGFSECSELAADALALLKAQEHCDGDAISRSVLLAAYDAAHKGPPGGARKLIEEAPTVVLKAQEPRLLTAEDFENSPDVDASGFLPCWVECNEKEMAEGVRMGIIEEGETLDGWTVVSKDELQPGSAHYNPNVRHWTSCPTNAQREATPWGREK